MMPIVIRPLPGGGPSIRTEWQSFRDEHLDALRRSLGRWPNKVVPLDVHSSGTIDGEDFVIDKLLYQTRPGLWASANLYRPAPGSARRRRNRGRPS